MFPDPVLMFLPNGLSEGFHMLNILETYITLLMLKDFTFLQIITLGWALGFVKLVSNTYTDLSTTFEHFNNDNNK